MANKHVLLKTVPPDSSLYHYTKCSGVQEVLQELEKEEWRRLLQERLLGALHAIKRRAYYIVSFSAEPDSITLWSEFGDNTGYNLEFQSGELIRKIELTKKVSYHGYVIYSEEEQKQIIQELLVQGIPKSLEHSFEDIMEKAARDRECRIFEKYCSSFEKVMMIYALFFKQEEFAAEKEYRMVFKSHTKKEVRYREKDGFLLPYITIRLESEKRNVLLKSITVAPKNHVDLAKEGMKQYLEHLECAVEVRLSKIKLRY